MRHASPARHRRQALASLAVVAALHVALLAALVGVRGGGAARRESQAPAPRVTLRLLAAPPPRVPLPAAEPAPLPLPLPTAHAAATRTRPARPAAAGAAAQGPDADAAEPIAPADAAARTQAAASVPAVPPSLLDGEATRRAIRAGAHAPSLTEQLARARDEPARSGAQQRLGDAVKAAGKGDCAKGEFAGAGMGLLSLPFLAAAVARGNCAQ